MPINPKQFRSLILSPILEQMHVLSGIEHTPFAEDLLMATAAQETHIGEYLAQEKGPALGIYQMEPATLHDLFDNYLNASQQQNVHWAPVLTAFRAPGGMYDFSQLPWNMAYATVLARINYFRVREALPVNSRAGLWYYYKKYWNTSMGAATQDEFVANLDKYTDIK